MRRNNLAGHVTLKAAQKAAQEKSELVEVRGSTGRLYCRFDPATMKAEFQHGKVVEVIDLSVYIAPRRRTRGR